MEILGIGPMEFILILIIALIVMGPNDMVKTGRTIGKFLRKLVTSPTWQAVQQTSRDLRYLPNKLMREAGMEEEVEEMKEIGQTVSELTQVQASLSEDMDQVAKEIQQTSQDLSAWTTAPETTDPPSTATVHEGAAPRSEVAAVPDEPGATPAEAPAPSNIPTPTE